MKCLRHYFKKRVRTVNVLTRWAQASLVEGFGEPCGDGLMNGFVGEIGVRWMVFDNCQRWVFHKIASIQWYAD